MHKQSKIPKLVERFKHRLPRAWARPEAAARAARQGSCANAAYKFNGNENELMPSG